MWLTAQARPQIQQLNELRSFRAAQSLPPSQAAHSGLARRRHTASKQKPTGSLACLSDDSLANCEGSLNPKHQPHALIVLDSAYAPPAS